MQIDSKSLDTGAANEFSIGTNASQSTISVSAKGRNNLSPSSTSSSSAAAAAGRHTSNINAPLFPISGQSPVDPLVSLPNSEDLEIKPGIAEMIREEERVCFVHVLLLFFFFFDSFLLTFCFK